MTTGFSLLDLMNVPPMLRRMMRLLLRHQHLAEEQLWTALRHQDDNVDRASFGRALADLIRMGWLAERDENGQPAYRIILRHAEARLPEETIVSRIDLNSVDDSARYRTELGVLASSQPVQAKETPLDGLDSLLQRGGKRTLPKSIWDKLDAPASPPAAPPPAASEEAPAQRSRGKDLLNLF